jgi:hypothetical protein
MQTQAQIFAAKAARTMAEDVLRTMKVVRWTATAIMLTAMIVSYAHQAHFLEGLGAPVLAAWSIPGAVDGLTFVCVRVLSTLAVVKSGRVVAGAMLAFPVSVSGVINFIAPGVQVVKWVYVAVVLLIPAAEIVASRIRPDFAAMDAMERKLHPVEQSANPDTPDTVAELESKTLPEAPVSPAVVRQIPERTERRHRRGK